MELLFSDIGLMAVAVGLIAGFFDSIAGGGGLITVPALLALGLAPSEALATNKLQGSFGTLSASLKFFHSGMLSLRGVLPTAAHAFIGAVLGALLVQKLTAEILEVVIPLLLMAFAVYFLFSPRVSDLDSRSRMGQRTFALTIGLGIGFYDGFFGPGTGSFFCFALIALRGYSIRKAIAHTKTLNLASNVGALAVFSPSGNILWMIGLLMGCGQMIGAWIGSHVVLANGVRLLRPLLVVASLAISAKLIISLPLP